MDDFRSINNHAELESWVDEQVFKYSKVIKNTYELKKIICPKDCLHDSLIGIQEYHDLPIKFDETIRNCQIVLRKIDIYYLMMDANKNSFDDIKKHCQEINVLNKIYVKKWNKIAPIVRSAVRTIKKLED